MSDIESQQISLWSGEKHLGLIPVKEVIDEHLSPGTMLSLKGDPPPKTSRAAPETYDYEVRRLKPSTTSPRTPKRKAYELFLNAHDTPLRLKKQLEKAYRILDHGSEAAFPVEFHIKVRPLPGLTGLSLFTWGRVDLHPAVILRALPEGAFQVVKPKVEPQGDQALWVVAPKDLQIGSVKLPDDPHEAASVIEKVVIEKREWLKELIDAQYLTPKGGMTREAQFKPRQRFGLERQIRNAQRIAQESEEKAKEFDDGQ